jgi:hypothetical protein
LVTVSVYPPEVEMTGFWSVDEYPLGPIHLKVAGDVGVVASSDTCDTRQLIGPDAPAVAPGAVIFFLTCMVVEDSHPLEILRIFSP